MNARNGLVVRREVFVFAGEQIAPLSRLGVFQRRESFLEFSDYGVIADGSALPLIAARPINKITSKLVIMTPPAVAMMVASLLLCDMPSPTPREI